MKFKNNKILHLTILNPSALLPGGTQPPHLDPHADVHIINQVYKSIFFWCIWGGGQTPISVKRQS